jgi:RNA polymerase sigma-70 factor (ECF subfamily)
MGRWAPQETVEAAVRGDETSVERLISAIWPGCFRLAASAIGDNDLAQDAAQEACAIVHRRVAGLRDPVAFDAWLYTIVMREAARVRRRNPLAAEPLESASTSVDGAIAIDVWSALSRLPPDQRDVVVLFYFDDLKTEDIARILRVAHATVRTRLNRARERLRGVLDDYDPQPRNEERTQYAI